MKFVALINLKKKRAEDRIVTFMYDGLGPLPPLVDPEDPEEAKDGGVAGPDVTPAYMPPERPS